MANSTIQQQITALEAELVLIKAQMAGASAGAQSWTVDGMSVQSVNYREFSQRRKEIEKSLQRLYRGGRGFVVDTSNTGTDSDDGDNTVYTRVQA